jgi:S1-C subfamily serine protease
MKDLVGEFNVSLPNVDGNADNWGYDVAIFHTKRHTNCWLAIGDDKGANPGDHVLTLGFPGLAFGSLTLYSGIMSARLQELLPAGKTAKGELILPSNDFLRVQMPISPGISGAPIIDDENRVIGVVTTAGAWSQDLEQLTEFQRMRDQQQNQLPPGMIDLAAATAHLASMIHDFASPGYGDAVPMHYLVRTKPPSTPPR